MEKENSRLERFFKFFTIYLDYILFAKYQCKFCWPITLSRYPKLLENTSFLCSSENTTCIFKKKSKKSRNV